MAFEKKQSDELRRGPWTAEEDQILTNYLSIHGEGQWNSVAKCAGLKRTGKSCRLRWLNYLRPDVRRGNITAEEQLLILELHLRWGNRWSKIAQHLPGRTDNEIKNYWRTRVQKNAKHLHCDVNSNKFRDAMHFLWMPHLLERIRVATGSSPVISAVDTFSASSSSSAVPNHNMTANGGGKFATTPCSSPPAATCNLVEGGGAKHSGWAVEEEQLGGGWPEYSGCVGNLLGFWELGDMGPIMWNEDSVWFTEKEPKSS